jgi:hypothetical protein
MSLASRGLCTVRLAGRGGGGCSWRAPAGAGKVRRHMPGVPGYIWRYAELEAILTEGIRVVALRVEWIADMDRRLAVGATIVANPRDL